MVIELKNVLGPGQLRQAREMLAHGNFVDGRLSAGKEAARVKHNEELQADAEVLENLNNIVMGSLVRHKGYQNAALPLRVAAPFYARYSSGMSYGEHIDDPVMGVGERYRSDIAITVFLNEPADYEGGELVIRTTFGEQVLKCPAGNAVLYPASSLHQVREVTGGERLVAVTWAQSMIRDPARRELVYELGQARDQLLSSATETTATALVSKSYVNLIRMWSEV